MARWNMRLAACAGNIAKGWRMGTSSRRKEEFDKIPFCVKMLGAEAAATRYLVYRTDKEFVSVNAASADEAVRLAGVESPQRILREETLQRLMLTQDMFG